jgi:hypothetical protein
LLSRRNDPETGRWSDTSTPKPFLRGARMSDMAEVSPSRRNSNKIREIGQRLLPACFIGTVLIAMAGWLWAIGRVVLGAVNWLLA